MQKDEGHRYQTGLGPVSSGSPEYWVVPERWAIKLPPTNQVLAGVGGGVGGDATKQDIGSC